MANNNNETNQATDNFNRARRSSVTSQTFTNLFGRSNSVASGAPTPSFPGPITTAAAQDQRRRMSIGTLGLSGSPTQAGAFFGGRRGSISTAGSDSIDENAIEDDDAPARSNPTTPFVRRMSFGAQALRNVRASGGGSPGTSGRTPLYTTAQEPSLASIPAGPRSSRVGSISQGAGVTSPNSTGNQASMYSVPRTLSNSSSVRPAEGNFNWGEQVRSRAESAVSQTQRPSFSTSPGFNRTGPTHDRAKSITEMPAPPTAVPSVAPRPAPKKPDAFQERILKGDFYMD